MHNWVLYRQTRRKNSMLLRMERDFLCVCTPETSASAKANKFSGSFAAVPVVSKCVTPKWCLPPTRAIKCLRLQSLFITPNTMFEPLSKNSMNAALKRWSPNPAPAGQRTSLKTTRRSLQKRLNALRTFWIVLLNAGLWRNCETILSRRRSLLRSALKRFAPFCMRKKSSFDESKHGKNATVRNFGLKKTNPPICKPTCSKWSDDLIRRIRPIRDSFSTGTNLLPYGPSEKTSCNVYSPPRRTALAGFLRCTPEKAVGLYVAPQTTSGISRSIEIFKEEVSGRSANSPDSGQFLTAPQSQGLAVLPREQYSFDLDANQCIMAQSYRMSIYPCQGIRDSWNPLSKPSGTQNVFE
jgi:hypothetical protein